MKTKILLATAVAALLSAGAVTAQIVNPNFDLDLTGWTTTGDVAPRSGGAFLTTATNILPGDDGPTEFNFSTFNVVDSFTLETFAGFASGGLDPDAANSVFAFEGSAIQQTFNVEAGDFIGFTWQLFTNETSGDDYAFVGIDGALFVLGTSASASSGSSFDYSRRTGLATYNSAVFLSAQTVILTIGVVDAGPDGAVSSALLIDAAVVPEPSTFALLALASFVGWVAYGRRRSSAAH